MRRFIAALFAFALCSAPAIATPPVLNGDIISSTLPVFNVLAYGAKGDDTTDNSGAITNAITAAIAAGGGTIYFPRGTYLVSSAIAIPFTGSISTPKQPPLRFTGDGANWNGYLSGSITSGGSALDMRYNGTTYNAKFNTFGAGELEVDHLTLEDNGTDSYPFFVTTNTTLFAHNVSCIGDSSHSGQTSTQDCWLLGENGYTASSASITSGSATLTIGAGDPPFNPNMVGWNVGIPGAGASGGFYSATISAYVSATQVTLSANASTTVTSGTANYFGIGNDVNAAFQGYGTHLWDNFYSRIRHGVTFNQYSNSVEVDNETYATDCGTAETNGAPYVFSGVPHFVNAEFGVRIHGGTVEVVNYPYVFELLQGDRDNLFDGVGIWDANGSFKGVVYAAASQAPAATGYSTILAAHTDANNANPIPYAGGPNASTITVVTGEQSGGAASFANGISAGIISGTTLKIAGGSNALPAVSDNGTAAQQLGTSANIAFGSKGTADTKALCFGSAGVANGITCFGATGGTAGGITGDTAEIFLNGVSDLFTLDHNGNVGVKGTIDAAGHNVCSSTSGVPCETTISCSVTSATSCSATATVPSGSVCVGSYNRAGTTSVTATAPIDESVSGTTLTMFALFNSAQTGSIFMDVHCL